MPGLFEMAMEQGHASKEAGSPPEPPPSAFAAGAEPTPAPRPSAPAPPPSAFAAGAAEPPSRSHVEADSIAGSSLSLPQSSPSLPRSSSSLAAPTSSSLDRRAAPPMPASSSGGSRPCGSGRLLERNQPTEKKFEDILQLLQELERLLVEPRDLAAVGNAYRELKEWTRLHQCDPDLEKVLNLLHYEFPAWKRQALEEAYRLFFDDVAKDRAVTRDLPEPPTSEEMGFRRLPEDLFSADVAAGKAPFKGAFEDRTPCMLYLRRYEYQIVPVRCKGSRWQGRQIVQKEQLEKPFPCAGELFGNALRRLIEVVVPIDQCCSRRSEAPKACGPFFLPSDGRTPLRLPPEAKPPLPSSRAAKKPPREPCT